MTERGALSSYANLKKQKSEVSVKLGAVEKSVDAPASTMVMPGTKPPYSHRLTNDLFVSASAQP